LKGGNDPRKRKGTISEKQKQTRRGVGEKRDVTLPSSAKKKRANENRRKTMAVSGTLN